jgi:hypothetical protein
MLRGCGLRWCATYGSQASNASRAGGIVWSACRAGALRPTRIPSARRRSRRRAAEQAAGSGPREARYATQAGYPEVSPGATTPRACRLRVGIPAKNDAASAGRLAPLMDAAPPAPRASPSARRRSRRRPASTRTLSPGASAPLACSVRGVQWPLAPARPHANRGAGTGRPRWAARSALCHRIGAPGSIARRTSATVQAARRHPGEMAARWRSWARGPSARRASPSARRERVMPPNRGTRKQRPALLRHARAGCTSASRCGGRGRSWMTACSTPRKPSTSSPSARRAPPSARRRSRRRTTGAGRRKARYATQHGHPEVASASRRSGARRNPWVPAARRASPSAPAVAAPGTRAAGAGMGRRGSGGAKPVMPPNPLTRQASPGATAPRARGLRVALTRDRAPRAGFRAAPQTALPSGLLPVAPSARNRLQAPNS